MRRLVIVFAICCGAAPDAQGFTDLWVFGTSSWDVGNGNLLGIKAGWPVPAAPSPPYYMGRFSNGPNWIDVVAEGLGRGPLEPSLLGGKNFAYGAARTGNGFRPFAGLSIPNVGAQIAELEAAGWTIQSTDLVALRAGGNDIGSGVSPTAVVANLADHITTLHDLGARNFFIANLTTHNPGPNPREGFNALLAEEVDALKAVLPDTRFAFFDHAAFQEEVVSNLSEFGFSHGLGELACQDCGGGIPSSIPTNIALDPETYMFWDGHPSAAYHALIGARALEVVATIPEPSTVSLTAIIGGLLVVRRQIISPRRRNR